MRISYWISDVCSSDLQGQQATLDRAHRSTADVAVGGHQGLRVLRHEGKQRAQVLEVEQQQAVVVSHLERDGEHDRLGLVELQLARQQTRPDLRDRRAQRMSL